MAEQVGRDNELHLWLKKQCRFSITLNLLCTGRNFDGGAPEYYRCISLRRVVDGLKRGIHLAQCAGRSNKPNQFFPDLILGAYALTVKSPAEGCQNFDDRVSEYLNSYVLQL